VSFFLTETLNSFVPAEKNGFDQMSVGKTSAQKANKFISLL
jgi:hypothetical protein